MKTTTRREFIRTSAATTALFAAPALVRGQNLNSKVQMASIGSDGKGWSDTNEMSSASNGTHVAFCDVDLNRTGQVRKYKPDAPIFQDYREMLTQLADQIDAVTVSTPDHMHAYISLDAMRRGKHVYCQKPLTHNVWEARQMRAQAAKSKVITRLGNQIHSHSHYRTAVSLVQNGTIGKIKRVHSWCAATGHGKSGFMDRPKSPPPAPDSVNWDLWIGVARMRPYGGNRVYHPWGWRDWQEFGNGALGDFGCHILDPVYTALKIEKIPTSLQADHTGMNDEVWPAQTTVHYTYPGTEWTVDKELKITWYDGGALPSVNGTNVPPTAALPRSGSLLVGEEGSLVIPHVAEPKLYPEEKFADHKYEVLPSLNHYHDWVDGIFTTKQPTDDFEYGGKLTEAVLLGNIGVRYRGKTLHWDEATMKFTKADATQKMPWEEENTAPTVEELNKWLRRDYREGWDIAPVA